MYVKHFYPKFQYWLLRCECKLQERYSEFIDLIDNVLIPKATQAEEKVYLFKIRRGFSRFFVEGNLSKRFR